MSGAMRTYRSVHRTIAGDSWFQYGGVVDDAGGHEAATSYSLSDRRFFSTRLHSTCFRKIFP